MAVKYRRGNAVMMETPAGGGSIREIKREWAEYKLLFDITRTDDRRDAVNDDQLFINAGSLLCSGEFPAEHNDFRGSRGDRLHSAAGTGGADIEADIAVGFSVFRGQRFHQGFYRNGTRLRNSVGFDGTAAFVIHEEGNHGGQFRQKKPKVFHHVHNHSFFILGQVKHSRP